MFLERLKKNNNNFKFKLVNKFFIFLRVYYLYYIIFFFLMFRECFHDILKINLLLILIKPIPIKMLDEKLIL